MAQNEILDRLIQILCEERGEAVPSISDEQKPDLFRALCNVRPPMPATKEFLRLQDEYLSQRTKERGVVDVNEFVYRDGIALWRGDITRLNADAVVSACNSALLGCFHPLHNCIDNVIHSAAGVQVRLDCNAVMRGSEEQNGRAKVTKAYNLPSRYIFHTVGPIVYGGVTEQNCRDLESCYLSCLKMAVEMKLSTLAFCCISTGEYRYPKNEACRLAVQKVKKWKLETGSSLKIIFNVFLKEDEALYERELFGQDQ